MDGPIVGSTLAHYRIDALLGRGGMGVVYRAFDTHLQRTVAIKLLQATPTGEDTGARLLKEARAASALNHANLCTIHEVGEIDGQAYIVMEHVDGRPLSRTIPPGEGLPLEQTLAYSMQMADGLNHAHERGTVHRDLKSANIAITPEGRLKILDFGVARRINKGERVVETVTMTGTADEEFAGTPLYMAPELLRGEPGDVRSDIWALGVVMYEMASGQRPFDGQSRYEVTSAILRDPPRPFPPRVAAGLRAVIAHCLMKDPDRRYQCAAEVKAALEAVSSSTLTGMIDGVATVAHERPSAALQRPGVVMTVVVATVAIVLGIALAWPRLRPAVPVPIESIAVVPQLGTPAGSEAEYLTDGISEGVINRLAHSGRSSVRVIALASTIRYKDRAIDPREIGRELGVNKMTLLRVARLPNAWSISVELVDVRDGMHVWGEQYSTQTTNLVEVQSEIASQIADNLNLRLSGADKLQLKKRYTENIEAYQAYLRGREAWYRSQFGPEGYQKSLEFYQQALALDPSYALAYSGVADTYVTLAGDGWIQPQEAYEKAQQAATRALAIDPNLGEVHFSLAIIKYVFGLDWAGGEKEYQRSIELNPNNAAVHRYYAQLLLNLHRSDAAIAEMKKSLELDPLGPETNKAMGATFYWLGRYDEAIGSARRTLELDPNFASAHQLLSDVYARKHMYRESIVEQQAVLKLAGDEDAAAELDRAYVADGYDEAIRGFYRKVLTELTEANKVGWVSPVAFVIAHAKLGEKDHAFAWLDKTYSERSPWLVFLRTDPDCESLRSDPRFNAFAQRVGMP